MSKVKNRFNNIDSKEWLPFQKSWFHHTNDDGLYRSNVRFFTQANEENPVPKVYFNGKDESLFAQVCKEEQRETVLSPEKGLQFALIDFRDQFSKKEDYFEKKESILKQCYQIYEALQHRKFLCILVDDNQLEEYHPISWDLAGSLQQYFSLKDEKVACSGRDGLNGTHHFYCLYFRKDEKSPERKSKKLQPFACLPASPLKDSWAIIRPPRRKKNEVLHPAKYPEQLIEMFIDAFSQKGENVYDPMSGTGSSQVAALHLGRNAYGCELSSFFQEIAETRCKEAAIDQNAKFSILNIDARKAPNQGFPQIDYIITSPPYWDMLNMKGAEYQATRKSKGLQLNYSDDQNDLGNIPEYEAFLEELMAVYRPLKQMLKKGGCFTIIVKNIKKKGSNYPLAWDLSAKMCSEGWELLPEFHWCQDDINIAPYGYGNTWVSNTFHQYCITFRNS